MKNILFTILAILSISFVFSQSIPKLKLTREGVIPIVVEVKEMSASDTYNQALNWVQESYKNPDKVLKTNIENKKIRIEGFESNAIGVKSMGIVTYLDISYSVEVSFKDGKYRFEYIIRKFSAAGKKVFYSYPDFYKKKDGSVKKVYIYSVLSLENAMNNLSLSFYNYVSGRTTKINDDW